MVSKQEKDRREKMIYFGLGPEAMKGIKVCKECGASVDSNLLFCDKCGSSLPSESLYLLYVHSHFVCMKCKTVVKADYSFCPHCGSRLV